MNIARINPPVLKIIDAMRDTGIWPDNMPLSLFENTIMNGSTYGIEVRGETVGYFMLHSYQGIQVQEDLVILPQAQGKWATKEAFKKIRDIAVKVAFDELCVERIVGYVDETNEKSKKMTEHMGMKCEGRLRHFSIVGGEWRNMLVYSLLRNEA